MSNFKKPKEGSPGWKAISHMWRAEIHARSGNRSEYDSHIKKAHQHVGDHVKHLTESGEHDDAIAFNDTAQNYLKKLDGLIKESERGEGSWRVRVKKSEALEKAYNPRYQYKHYGDLSHEDQIRAAQAFNERDMHSHVYPTDPASGEFVHAPRLSHEMAQKKGISMDVPRNTSQKKVPLAAANQRVGARVRVNAPGHEHDGRQGMVQMKHPSMPDRVNVRVSTKSGRFENAYLLPHQVELAPPGSVKKSESSSSSQNKRVVKKASDVLRVIQGKRRE